MTEQIVRRCLACTAFVAGIAAAPPGAPAAASEPPLQMHLVPAACQDPCNVRMRVLVTPDDDNRALALSAESAGYLRRSVMPLEGADAARLHVMLFTALPAGTYTLEARVSRASAADLITTRTVLVRGG